MKTAFLAAAIGLAAAGALSAQTATPPTADTSAASPTVPAEGSMTTAPAATTTTATTTTAPAGSAAVAVSPLTPQDFVSMAASGGMFEVMSSQLALERSASDEVKEFAQMMVADHTKANDELKIVAAANNLTVPADMMGGPAEHMRAVEDADAGVFEETYLQHQAQAHAETIALFEAQAAATTNPDLAAFAQKTLPTLQMHAEHLQRIAQ